jgi:hypothetical protein
MKQKTEVQLKREQKRAVEIIANGLSDPQVSGPARWHLEQAAKALAA